MAAAIYWLPLRRSVRIEGVASKISKEDSEKYFHSRPRASQIGALASPQSQPISDRAYLDTIERGLIEKYGADQEIPLPNWVRNNLFTNPLESLLIIPIITGWLLDCASHN